MPIQPFFIRDLYDHFFMHRAKLFRRFSSFLFENQKVEKETFVGPVSIGDVIKIQFAGLEKEDRFQDYGKKFDSKWKEKICRQEGSLDPGMGFKVFISCDNEVIKKEGEIYQNLSF